MANEIVLRMRRMYCCVGSEFTRPELQAGWEEIERLEAELARVRGLLQRQWISVEERLPDGHGKFWCWVVPKLPEESPHDTSGNPICAKFPARAEVVGTYLKSNMTIAFNCGGLSKVTHWMRLPESPIFRESSSLVSQGAESADIGKLDNADKSGKINRVYETHGDPLEGTPAHTRLAKKFRDDMPGMEFTLNQADNLALWLLHEYEAVGRIIAGSAETGGREGRATD